MSRFVDDTAVQRIGEGAYTAEMDGGWRIVNGPNGGYVAAVLARAVLAEVAHTDGPDGPDRMLRSLTLHYLRPAAEGPTRIDVVVERRGRSVVTTTARLSQDNGLVAVALAAVAGARPAPEFDETVAPDAPPPETVPTLVRPVDGPVIPMHERYEMRPCVGSAAADWVATAEPKPAVSGGWLRFAESTPVDALALTALTDAWIPPVFHRMPGEPMAVPTVDLTVHVRQLPADPLDWVLVRFTSPLAIEGYLLEDGEIWDRAGNLLAVSRQLAVLV